MGNKQPINSSIPIFEDSQWEQIESPQLQHPQYGWYRTFTSLQTTQLIDQYQVIYTEHKDYLFYLDSFLWRLNQPDIVQTLFLKENHKEQLCSKSYIAKVYIQHIETRLSDITDIPYPENLYVLQTALEGYQKLFSNLHYFRVEQNQICVDEKGYVRVWVNADLSKSFPIMDDEAQGGDQCSMVQQIIAIIAENTDQESEPQSLKDYYKEEGDRIGFEKAKIILNEYARKHKAAIPDYFESILEVYQQNQNQSSQHQKVSAPQIPQQQPINKMQKSYHPSSPQFFSSKVSNQQPDPNHPQNTLVSPPNRQSTHPQQLKNTLSYQNLHQPILCYPSTYQHNLPYYHHTQYPYITTNPLGYQPTYTEKPPQIMIYRMPQKIAMQPTYLAKTIQKTKSISQLIIQKNIQPKLPNIKINSQAIPQSSMVSNKSTNQINSPHNYYPKGEPSSIESQLSKAIESEKLKSLPNVNQSSQNTSIFNENQPLIVEAPSFRINEKKQFKDVTIRKVNFQKGQKTVYYTADTQQQLDPEIAADLKQLYSKV